jgi:hypothetical protein
MPAAERLLHLSLAPSTRKNYESIRKSYESFCRCKPYSLYPASIISITDWIASLAKTVKAVTIKGYINALRSYHIERGLYDSSFADPHIELVIKGLKQYYRQGK